MLVAEGMILLSRIIKSYQTKEQTEQKVSIKIKQFLPIVEVDQETHELTETTIHERLEQANLDAEKILKQANEHAEAITTEIQQAKDKWELEEKPFYMEQAQKEGYQQGIEDGIQKGYREMAESIAYAREMIDLAKQEYGEKIEAAQPVVLELAMKVAGKIIGYELNENESTFLSIVKRAIKEVRNYCDVQLHVHPSQYPFVLSQKDELNAIFPKNTDFYIYPNEDLSENSCVIESENGRIDASVDSQLQEMKVKLIELLEGEL